MQNIWYIYIYILCCENQKRITLCFNVIIVTHVSFSNCTTGEIRLTNGTTEYEGRVEVCINGVWGTVCDSGWYTTEAYAVCHQLGYQGI